MKPKPLFLAIAAVLVAGGLWFARSAWRTHASQKPSMGVGFKRPPGPSFGPNSTAALPKASQTDPSSATNSNPNPGQMLNSPARLAPPNPNRRFTDFTPEQRVQFARQGHGPGG